MSTKLWGTFQTETATLRPYSGEGGMGPCFGDPVSVEGVFEQGFKRVTNAKGEEVVASLTGFLLPGTAINIGDEITFRNRRYRVVDVQAMAIEGHETHVEVYFQSAGAVR